MIKFFRKIPNDLFKKIKLKSQPGRQAGVFNMR